MNMEQCPDLLMNYYKESQGHYAWSEDFFIFSLNVLFMYLNIIIIIICTSLYLYS